MSSEVCLEGTMAHRKDTPVCPIFLQRQATITKAGDSHNGKRQSQRQLKRQRPGIDSDNEHENGKQHAITALGRGTGTDT